MRKWLRRALTVSLGLTLAVIAAAGQTRTYRASRAADAKPNFNGIWQALNEAYWDIEAHAAAPSPVIELGAAHAVAGGLSIIEGGTLPYKPEALAKKQRNYANRLELDPEIKCYLPGVPRANYMPYPFQVIQGPKYIMMIYTYGGAVRTIYMDEHKEAPADSWMGWSNGHWDGDALVVDTTGFNDKTWFDRAGNFHSDALHVVERYTATSPDHLLYEATIEDPNVFTRPWKISMLLYRRLEKNAQIMEFRCVEFVEELMYGHLRKKPGK
ncbi:MAG: hypothetical protein DMG00_14725 [Acidobacteria bacterium]|nr:MAG: hypothetical protein DMG00_14725 [Acidobacteriota bacterium]